MTAERVQTVCVLILIAAAIAAAYSSCWIFTHGYFFESLLPLVPFGLFESAVVYVLEHYE